MSSIFILPFAAVPSDQLVRIGLFVLALAVIWMVLRFLLRLAGRIFTLGCTLILLVGVVLFLLRVLGR